MVGGVIEYQVSLSFIIDSPPRLLDSVHMALGKRSFLPLDIHTHISFDLQFHFACTITLLSSYGLQSHIEPHWCNQITNYANPSALASGHW